MRGEKIITTVFALIVFSVCNVAFSQESKISGKYIAINNIEEFIVEKDGFRIADCFYVCNFSEEESSKPDYLAVTEINGVVKFSIESSSSTHAGQRRCRLVIRPESWKFTLRNAFLAMNIEYILVNNEYVAINDYFNSLK